MGISADRAMKLETLFKGYIDTLFAGAINNRLTHEEILFKRKELIYNLPDWKKLPHYVERYLQGYWDARKNELYRYHLEWRNFLPRQHMTQYAVDNVDFVAFSIIVHAPQCNDGIYLSREESHQLRNRPGFENIYKHFDNERSAYMWKNSNCKFA